MNALKKLNEVINQCTGHDYQISCDTSISADLGIASLDFFEIICSIEQTFQIKVDDSKIAQFQKIGDLVDYIENSAALKEDNPGVPATIKGAAQQSKLTVHTERSVVLQKESTNSERANAIDIAKAICMFFLPFTHVITAYALGCNMVDFGNFNPGLLETFTALGPGVFMICMGYDIRSDVPCRKLLSQGTHLLLIGFILNIFRYLIPYSLIIYMASNFSVERVISKLLESDIYYMAGLFYLLLAFLKKLKSSDFIILAVSILMLAVNTIITHVNIPIDNVLISRFLGNFFYVEGDSTFPILGWAIFPIVGMLLACNPLEKISKKRLFELLVCFISVLAAFMVSLWYFGLDIYSIAVNPNNDYIIETFNAIIQIGLAVIFLYALQLILASTGQTVVEKFLKKISYYLMPFYCIHWIIIMWINIPLCFLFFYKASMPVWMLALIIVMITALSLLLSVKFGMKFMRFMIKMTSPFSFKTAKKSNKKKKLREKTLHELVKSNGTYDSVIYMESAGNGVKKLSRKDLNHHAALVAGYLAGEGYENEKIAVFCNKSIEWAIAFYGITYGRNIAVLFNPELPIDTILAELELSECTAILYPEEIEEKVKTLFDRYSRARTILSFAELMQDIQTENTYKTALSVPTENDVAAMLFSSGTTGTPKCVQLTHKNFVSNIMAIDTMCAEYDWGGKHNTVVVLPVFHAFSLTTSVLFPLYNGGSALFNQSVVRIVSDIKKAKPDYISLVPQLAKMLANLSSAEEGNSLCEKLGGSVNHIFCGGAPMPKELRQLYKDSGILLCNGYGITECSPLVSVDLNNHGGEGNLGYIIPGVNVRISDEGEIRIKGDNVTPGYYNNPKANEKSFYDGWFKTGDIGEINPDGSLKFIGRIKNLIILSNGENISAESIENMLSTYPHILGLRVFEENDHLAVEIYPDWSVQDVEQSIRDSINLANYNLPSIWRICAVYFRKEDFVRTAIGKIVR